MRTDSGSTTSVWMEAAGHSNFPELDKDERTDVCIVGGAGIAGLTTAYVLAREGTKVIVVNDGPPAAAKPDARRRIWPMRSTTATSNWRRFTARKAHASQRKVTLRRSIASKQSSNPKRSTATSAVSMDTSSFRRIAPRVS
jgi:flavin-dependent dehydrogenase